MPQQQTNVNEGDEPAPTLPVVYSGGCTAGHQEIKIYNVSGHDQSKLPSWILEKYQKRLKKDSVHRKRIQLIQDFGFPEASNRIQFTPNERFIVATGIYKPQIRVYDLDQLCMKFERHTDAETVQFRFLDQDWTKMVLLQSDRNLEFHTQGGIHYRTRIPKFGRDLVYDPVSCDVVTVGASHEAYRLNLDQGRFLKGWETSMKEVNSVRTSTLHRLYALGGSNNRVEFWDPRTRICIGGIQVPSNFSSSDQVTALHFLPNGLHLALGTNNGIAHVYDLRYSSSYSPLVTKDHNYQYPIHSIDYDPKQRLLMTVDQKIVKMWRLDDGETVANIESPHKIHDFCWQHNTGLFLEAVEDTMMQGYYMPALGPAPSWCQHLEHLTEELEENPKPLVYDHYRFVTRTDLEQLGLSHLIGTGNVHAYMHGFFIDQQLYDQAKAITEPFAYEKYQQEQIKDRIMREQETRIRADPNASIRVNKALAKFLKTQGKTMDTRFSKELFTDPDFAIEGSKATSEYIDSDGVVSHHSEDDSDA